MEYCTIVKKISRLLVEAHFVFSVMFLDCLVLILCAVCVSKLGGLICSSLFFLNYFWYS